MYSVYIHHIDTKLSISYRQLTNRHLRFYFIFTKRKISNLFQFSFFRFIDNKKRCCYRRLVLNQCYNLYVQVSLSVLSRLNRLLKKIWYHCFELSYSVPPPLAGARFVDKKGCGGSGKRRIRGRKGGRVGIRGIKVMRIWIYRP